MQSAAIKRKSGSPVLEITQINKEVIELIECSDLSLKNKEEKMLQVKHDAIHKHKRFHWRP